MILIIAVSSLKKRHDSLVKLPDVEFGKFPEIKIVQSKKKRNIKKPKIVISKIEKEKERPPTPEKAKLVPELPLKVRFYSNIYFYVLLTPPPPVFFCLIIFIAPPLPFPKNT